MFIDQRAELRIGAADCGPQGMSGGAIMRLFRGEEGRFWRSEAGAVWQPVVGGEVIEIRRRPAAGAEVIVTTVVDRITDEGAELVQTVVAQGAMATQRRTALGRILMG